VARARAAQAAALLTTHGADPSNVFITERPGHARELALAATARGISTIVAWGGDGTMNEIASAIAFTDTVLALVPSGSGNGLARELRIPFDAAAALALAFNGRERQKYPVSDMVFSPRQIVSRISRELTLEPGDLIACGTSLGAGVLRPGQTVEVAIDGVGALRNQLG